MTRIERKTYTKEFKQEAVRLAEESELPMTQIARRLGVHRNMLARWRKQLGEPAGADRSVGVSEQAELQQLRAEVQALRRERDILKKALEIISRAGG